MLLSVALKWAREGLKRSANGWHGAREWWAGRSAFLAFFSMEFVQWRRVNGIFCAFVEDIMCVCCRLVLARGHGIEHAGDACVAVIGFALYGYDKSLNVQNGIAHL